MPLPPSVESVQEFPTTGSSMVGSVYNKMLTSVTFGTSMIDCPGYWSTARDEWLTDFVKLPGNDLLAGGFSTLVSRVVSTPVYFEGPLALAMLYKNLFLSPNKYSRGWTDECSSWVQGFLGRDFGGAMEVLRTGPTDITGPALGLAHLDESKCEPTGNPEYPVIYYRDTKDPIWLHRSQVRLLTDMPDPRDEYLGVGFCSVSRALSTASILLDIVRYKRERLSDLPPAGILFINNMVEQQWTDLLKKYDTRQRNEGNQVWKDLLVAFGIDPMYPITAELFELSKLPEAYDEEKSTSIAIYSFALAFRVDPREFWPVSGGPLGTAREADIQHKKAKSKGEGIIFTSIERLLNQPDILPEGVTFRFDYRDTEEDETAANIKGMKIQNIRRMWDPPSGSAGFSQPQAQFDEEGNPIPSEEPQAQPMGIITTEEARQLLILEDIVPPEVLGQALTVDKVYDVRHDPWLYGPKARVYNDGRVVILK